jgi:hypothetical protein
VNDPIEDLAAQSLAEYAKALQSIRPSAQLDARLHQTFRSFENRARRQRHVRLAIAAGLGAIAVGGAIFVERLKVLEYAAHVSPSQTLLQSWLMGSQARRAGMSSPLGQVSPWPSGGAVFRVRTSAASWSPGSHFDPGLGEPQFWIDVRVGNDSSMQVVRIIPVAEIVSARAPYSPVDVVN